MPITTDRVAVFYHCARMGSWSRIDAEIMGALRGSRLTEVAKPFVRNECADVSQFEFPTLDLICQFARDNDDYAVLYLHTKGASNSRPSIDDWRAMMLYWMVQRWQECVAKLAAGYDAVGTTIIDSPARHYQGNFWWATTAHIRRCGNARDVVYTPTHANQTERHKAEFWIIANPEAKPYEPYRHPLNPYQKRNPPRNYRGRRF